MASNAYKRASLIIQKARGPKWKRELVSDHKFDFMDVDGFRENSCLLTMRYFILLCSVVVSTLVYGADLWSAGILLIYDHWSLSTQPKIPFAISKWIYVGCIVISFMLLAWEIRKTRTVMETRDISLAVTNPLAYRTFSIKSYSHFCLLQKIKSSTKWSDVVIFYVFYTLKTWKRVIIAQGPRQIIAGITVYALLKSAWTAKNGSFQFSSDWDTYGQDWPQRVALFLMSFTCILWVISAIQIVISILLYFPILCHIQGNLKEYCCHKIDKRIDELLEKQRKKRIREREKYANSISSKKSKKSYKKNNTKFGDEVEIVPALPTLPVINNVNLYAGAKTDASWLYEQPQQQNSFNNYYDNQPMTALESSYSLQRNPTKYSPYNDPSYTSNSQNQIIHKPVGAYAQQDYTNNYYYSSSTQQQCNNNINSPLNNTTSEYFSATSTAVHKPNVYNDTPVIGNTTTTYNSNAFANSYYKSPKPSTVTESYNQLAYNSSTYQKATSKEAINNTGEIGAEDSYLPIINNNTKQNAMFGLNQQQQEGNSIMQGDAFTYHNSNNAGGNQSQQLQDQYYYNDNEYQYDGTDHTSGINSSKNNLSTESQSTKKKSVIKPQTYSNYI